MYRWGDDVPGVREASRRSNDESERRVGLEMGDITIPQLTIPYVVWAPFVASLVAVILWNRYKESKGK